MASKRLGLLLAILTLPTGAAARQPGSLGDLNIPAERVPDWFAAPDGGIPDTSGWTVVDVTEPPYNADPADNANNDRDAIQRAIADASPKTVIYLPRGTYNIIGTTSINISKSEVVLRGDGDSTVVKKGGDAANAPGFPNSCDLRAVISAWGSGAGSSVTWNSGFRRGDTIIGVSSTSGFSAGDYIMLQMDDDSSLLDNPDGSGPFWRYIVRVVSAGSSTLTIDRPLRYHFDQGGKVVYRLNEIRSIGVENLKLTYVNQSAASNCGQTAGICFRWVVDGWISGVRSENVREWHTIIRESARNLVFNNTFSGQTDTNMVCNYALWLPRSATDNVVHNNIFKAAGTTGNGVTIQQGSNGNVVSYNYFDDMDRPIFFHGTFPYENLIEGNVMSGGRAELDNYWGRQGDRNTFFRNRSDDILSTEVLTSSPVGTSTNILLNSFLAYISRPGCGAYSTGKCFAFDRMGHDNVWLERNIWLDTRGVDQCTAVSAPFDCCTGPRTGSCAFGWSLEPDPTTSCGVSSGPGNCDLSPSGDAAGENFETLAPDTWSNPPHGPLSLVSSWNSQSTRPPGWCQEAPWPAIGADVDDSSPAQIPAQRRATGASCTPPVGSPPPPPLAPPAAPLLLE